MLKHPVWKWLIAGAYLVTVLRLLNSWLPIASSEAFWKLDEVEGIRMPPISFAYRLFDLQPASVAAAFGVLIRLVEISLIIASKYWGAILLCCGIGLLNVAESISVIASAFNCYVKGGCNDLGFGMFLILLNTAFIMISFMFATAASLYFWKVRQVKLSTDG